MLCVHAVSDDEVFYGKVKELLKDGEKMEVISKSFILSIKDSEGASAVEYAILIALISAVIIVTVGFLGTNTRGAFDSVIPAFSTEKQKDCNDSSEDDNCGIGNDNK